MARIRRIIRKLKPPQYQPIDEQLWPVIVALVVLGGFTMGSLLAYLRYDDPRWYANSLTWLVVAALLFGGAAVALTLVDNRAFRRSMQLAILLGLLLHAVLLVVSFELEVFGRLAVHVSWPATISPRGGRRSRFRTTSSRRVRAAPGRISSGRSRPKRPRRSPNRNRWNVSLPSPKRRRRNRSRLPSRNRSKR